MTPEKGSPEASMGDTAADQLRALGTRGVLVQMAKRGQLIELRCEMPNCYCPRGGGQRAERVAKVMEAERT